MSRLWHHLLSGVHSLTVSQQLQALRELRRELCAASKSGTTADVGDLLHQALKPERNAPRGDEERGAGEEPLYGGGIVRYIVEKCIVSDDSEVKECLLLVLSHLLLNSADVETTRALLMEYNVTAAVIDALAYAKSWGFPARCAPMLTHATRVAEELSRGGEGFTEEFVYEGGGELLCLILNDFQGEQVVSSTVAVLGVMLEWCTTHKATEVLRSIVACGSIPQLIRTAFRAIRISETLTADCIKLANLLLPSLDVPLVRHTEMTDIECVTALLSESGQIVTAHAIHLYYAFARFFEEDMSIGPSGVSRIRRSSKEGGTCKDWLVGRAVLGNTPAFTAMLAAPRTGWLGAKASEDLVRCLALMAPYKEHAEMVIKQPSFRALSRMLHAIWPGRTVRLVHSTALLFERTVRWPHQRDILFAEGVPGLFLSACNMKTTEPMWRNATLTVLRVLRQMVYASYENKVNLVKHERLGELLSLLGENVWDECELTCEVLRLLDFILPENRAIGLMFADEDVFTAFVAALAHIIASAPTTRKNQITPIAIPLSPATPAGPSAPRYRPSSFFVPSAVRHNDRFWVPPEAKLSSNRTKSEGLIAVTRKRRSIPTAIGTAYLQETDILLRALSVLRKLCLFPDGADTVFRYVPDWKLPQILNDELVRRGVVGLAKVLSEHDKQYAAHFDKLGLLSFLEASKAADDETTLLHRIRQKSATNIQSMFKRFVVRRKADRQRTLLTHVVVLQRTYRRMRNRRMRQRLQTKLKEAVVMESKRRPRIIEMESKEFAAILEVFAEIVAHLDVRLRARLKLMEQFRMTADIVRQMESRERGRLDIEALILRERHRRKQGMSAEMRGRLALLELQQEVRQQVMCRKWIEGLESSAWVTVKEKFRDDMATIEVAFAQRYRLEQLELTRREEMEKKWIEERDRFLARVRIIASQVPEYVRRRNRVKEWEAWYTHAMSHFFATAAAILSRLETAGREQLVEMFLNYGQQVRHEMSVFHVEFLERVTRKAVEREEKTSFTRYCERRDRLGHLRVMEKESMARALLVLEAKAGHRKLARRFFSQKLVLVEAHLRGEILSQCAAATRRLWLEYIRSKIPFLLDGERAARQRIARRESAASRRHSRRHALLNFQSQEWFSRAAVYLMWKQQLLSARAVHRRRKAGIAMREMIEREVFLRAFVWEAEGERRRVLEVMAVHAGEFAGRASVMREEDRLRTRAVHQLENEVHRLALLRVADMTARGLFPSGLGDSTSTTRNRLAAHLLTAQRYTEKETDLSQKEAYASSPSPQCLLHRYGRPAPVTMKRTKSKTPRARRKRHANADAATP